ncbi:hypothetical protein PQX77_006706 [Marasmius sp. AFHP31]|nr:hypothetical protein PQX77_006706 [Marasmius sp. AFHP31]
MPPLSNNFANLLLSLHDQSSYWRNSPFYHQQDVSFLSDSFIDLINDSDALPLRTFTEPYLHISGYPDERNFVQRRYDIFNLDLQRVSDTNPEPSYCNTREVEAGLTGSRNNLKEWMQADGWVTTMIGFDYAGEKRIDFSLPFGFIPTRYSNRFPSFNHDMFKAFAKRFNWDGSRLTERRTGLPVCSAHGAWWFRQTVLAMWDDIYWRQRWSTLTPKVLANQVMVLAGKWFPDAELYAEYFLVHADEFLPFYL